MKTSLHRRIGGVAITAAIPAAVFTGCRFATALIPSAPLRILADAGIIAASSIGGVFAGRAVAGGEHSVLIEGEAEGTTAPSQEKVTKKVA
jgi:hypothetical protein